MLRKLKAVPSERDGTLLKMWLFVIKWSLYIKLVFGIATQKSNRNRCTPGIIFISLNDFLAQRFYLTHTQWPYESYCWEWDMRKLLFYWRQVCLQSPKLKTMWSLGNPECVYFALVPAFLTVLHTERERERCIHFIWGMTFSSHCDKNPSLEELYKCHLN